MIRPVSDPVGLEVRWDRLAAATDEAASTMLRTAFSTIIRESNDYTVVLMDRAGRTMAESRAGTPAFAALMSSLTALVLERFPADEWQDGDSVITNDPWIATGHLPDIAMISPVFHRGRLVAAAAVARTLGEQDVVSFDMGGTTAKIAVVQGSRPRLTHDFEAGRVDKFKPGSGLPVRLTVVDMIEIGSGGGWIAAPDALGLLKVGPRSAGSVPGPVAYGRGGERPTVTDADLLLGCLDAENFLGGEMRLRTREAHKALTREVAGPLGLDTADAAAGIVEVVTESMAAARMHLSERGKDPADFALLAFGGAGPAHAYGLAKSLKMPRVIVPMRAGVMSACGLLAAAPTVDEVRSLPSPLADVDWDQVTALYDEMTSRATETLQPGDPRLVRVRRSADMRYLGQGFEIEVGVPEQDLGPTGLGRVRTAFESTYRAVFGRSLDGAVEVVNWRLSMQLPGHELSTEGGHARGDEASRGVRAVYFPGHGLLEATVWNRYELTPGTELAGPAIFEERESSCSLGPDCRIRVTDDLTLVVEVDRA